jgi:hypothetical protein
MTQIFKNQSGTVSIVLHEQYAIYKMSGEINLQDYKEGFNRLLKEVKTSRLDSVLFDYTELKSDPALGRAWFVGKFVPNSKKILTSNSHFAIAQSSSMFQRMALEFIVKACNEMGLKFKVKYFDKLSEAQIWMETNLTHLTPIEENSSKEN